MTDPVLNIPPRDKAEILVPAVLFWNNTPVLMAFCALFVATYVAAYLMIVRFKVPRWLRP